MSQIPAAIQALLVPPPPSNSVATELSVAGHQERLQSLCQWMVEQGHDGAVIFHRSLIIYLTGYYFLQTERPVALVVSQRGETGLLIPALEVEHVAETETIAHVITYPDYPGLRHPMHFLIDLIDQMALDRHKLTADSPGYPSVWGYQGPTIATLVDAPVNDDVGAFLMQRRMRKGEEVLGLIRYSAEWGQYAHALMQSLIVPGANEVEVGQAASRQATLTLFEALGDRYRNHDWGVVPIHVGFKAGPETAIPHPLGGSRDMAAGDVIVTWAIAKMGGYHAELERTLILGTPTDEQRHYFELMCRAQETGIQAVRAGSRCADVDEAVYQFMADHDLLPYVRHHTGHGLDMDIHAPPYLDRGDQTVLEPGMLFSVEPGLYVPGVGGFRHSDTILVTEGDPQVLTSYPRALDDLTIPLPSTAMAQSSGNS